MIDYTAEDDEPSRFDWILAAVATLSVLVGLWLWGAWVERSDTKALQQIAAEKCRRDDAVFVAQDGSRVLCLAGSGRARR